MLQEATITRRLWLPHSQYHLSAQQQQYPGLLQGLFVVGAWHHMEISLSNSSAAGKCQEQHVLGPAQPLHGTLELHRAQPSPDTQPVPESIYLLQSYAGSTTVPDCQCRRTGNTQRGAGLHHATSKTQRRCCTDRSALAGLGRLGRDTQSCHQQPPRTHMEGPGWSKCDPRLWPAHSLQNTSWAAELPGLFHTATVEPDTTDTTAASQSCFVFLTSLPATTLPPL